MSIFKAHYTKKDGKKAKTSNYYIQFRSHLGGIHRLPAFKNRQLSIAFEAKIKEIVDFRKANLPLSSELKQWLAGLDNKILLKLQKKGLVNNSICPDLKKLEHYLKDYLINLEEHSCSNAHIDNVDFRILSFFKQQKISYPREIIEQGFVEFRRSLTCGNTTKNHYLVAIKSFCNWLVKIKALPVNPVSGISKLPENKKEHGILTPDQFLSLITTTERLGCLYLGVSAKERAILYLIAGSTGLRKSELAKLTWANVLIAECGIFLPGQYTKNGKDARLPIVPALAATLEAWKKELGANDTDRLFIGINSQYRAADGIREDLGNAGLPIVDMFGNKIVFHSLRGSFISFLANKDIPVKVTQQLARHSSPTLTMNVYAKVFSESEKTAISTLPSTGNLP